MIRSNEEAAIAQAVTILNSDDSFDTFGDTKAATTGDLPAFLQLSRRTRRVSVREQIREQLSRASRQHKSLRLARVAAMLQDGNPFDKVEGEVTNMVDIIAQEESRTRTRRPGVRTSARRTME